MVPTLYTGLHIAATISVLRLRARKHETVSTHVGCVLIPSISIFQQSFLKESSAEVSIINMLVDGRIAGTSPIYELYRIYQQQLKRGMMSQLYYEALRLVTRIWPP